MLGISFAFLAAILIALFQAVLRKSTLELKPSVSFFYDSLFGLVLWVPLAIFMGG